MIRVVCACLLLGLSSAAGAQSADTQERWSQYPGGPDSVKIPEPGDAALFTIAVAALIAGRQASKRPPREK